MADLVRVKEKNIEKPTDGFQTHSMAAGSAWSWMPPLLPAALNGGPGRNAPNSALVRVTCVAVHQPTARLIFYFDRLKNRV